MHSLFVVLFVVITSDSLELGAEVGQTVRTDSE